MKDNELFFENEVLVVEDDSTFLNGHGRTAAGPSVERDIFRTVASFVVAGVLTFGPFAISQEQAANQPMRETVVVRVEGAGHVQNVELTAAHRASAQRFRRFARAVPLNDAEKLPDPDFGL